MYDSPSGLDVSSLFSLSSCGPSVSKAIPTVILSDSWSVVACARSLSSTAFLFVELSVDRDTESLSFFFPLTCNSNTSLPLNMDLALNPCYLSHPSCI